MRLFVCLLVFINITYTIGSIEISNAKTQPKNNEDPSIPHIDLNNLNKTNIIINNNVTTSRPHETVTVANKLPHMDDDDIMKSGALLRGFYVLIGITMLLLAYIGFRMFRIQTGGNQPPVMVRKYGVLAKRGDVEMLPLPLSDDDDDDTVFELNHHANR